MRAEQGLQWRARWRDDSSIDLLSPMGTFVRGVIEADSLAVFDWDVEGEFPGVKRAVQTRKLWEPAWGAEFYNTSDHIFKIASVREAGGDAVTAIVCSIGQGKNDEASFPPLFDSDNRPTSTDRGISIVRLTINTEGEKPPEERPGDRLFPGYDVFGDWWVSEYKNAWAPNVPGEPKPDTAVCGDMGDLTAPGPSYPGWSGSGV
ncbi:hypothetical protein O0V02_19580 [Gordonia amicalis]|uniref:hypothetical protein n=1 Tax=Gordonia amicalis TaxID=89053 RepID=UPI0022A7EF20|nr:hypothetical protein [Gordonia amicalis]MCZ0914597.1 hypothetical protein [Gordonia amicalis]